MVMCFKDFVVSFLDKMWLDSFDSSFNTTLGCKMNGAVIITIQYGEQFILSE